MRLVSLSIGRLPGIRSGFSLDRLAPGVNVIVGPNASGKSSVVRALRSVLYAEEKAGLATSVEAAFDTAAGRLEALRLGHQLDWQQQGQSVTAPPRPEYRFLSCFTLGVEDLLDGEAGTDAAIAERLSRELAGGYDIGAIRGAWPFRVKQGHGRQAGQELDEARRERRRKEQAREALRADEARLADLEQRKAAAEGAQAEAARAAAAVALLDARHARQGLEQRLAAYPEGMSRLRGDEGDELASVQQRYHERADALKRARDQAGEAENRNRGTGLASTDIDQPAISEQRNRLQRLQTLEHELAGKRRERDNARSRFDGAVAALGGEPDVAVAIDPATLDRVDQALADKRDLDAAIRELGHELDRLPEPDETLANPETLTAGRDALIEWLGAPRQHTWPTYRWVAASLGLAAGASGIGAGAYWGHVGVALLLIPWTGGVMATVYRPRAAGQHTAARTRYERLGLALPSAWTREAVQQQLVALDRELHKAREVAAQTERRAEAERLQRAKGGQLDEVLANLRETGRELGFDVTRADTAFDRWLRLTREYDEARRELREAQAQVERLERDAADERKSVVTFLLAHGEPPGTDEPSAERVAARLDALAQRLDSRDKAQRDKEEAERTIKRLATDLDETQRAVESIYQRAGLTVGDEATLRQRLDWVADWHELARQLDDARVREADRTRELGNAPEWVAWVDADDREAIERRHRELTAEAADRDALLQEIERIHRDIERAGHDRWLEEARAREQAGEEALRDQREEALFADAGSYLLDQVASEHSRTSQPAALERAQAWFADFTHHAYHMELGVDGDGAFTAIENATGERRRLGELSSGTRMQLVMSVRIAFAIEAEQGAEPLPLILDEALTTADPERFRAAVAGMRKLAEDGRQVFYLTAQPTDIGYWREADPDVHWIDLAQLRQQAAALQSADSIALPEETTIPAPADDTPEAYAVRLGVPTLDPWAGAEAIPVFYVLRDDLVLLQRLLELRIDTLGALASYLGSRSAERLFDETVRDRLAWRVSGARAWLAAWRVGRGFPVDREALWASNAVSTTFLDRVDACNQELAGDGARLVGALADGAVKGFRAQAREQLAEWLAANGYIDERESFTEEQILHRVIEAIAPWLPDNDAAIREGKRIRDSLAAAMATDGGGDQPAPS